MMKIILVLWYVHLPAPIIEEIDVPYPSAGIAWIARDHYIGNYTCKTWGGKVWDVYKGTLPKEYQKPKYVAVACELEL